MPTIRTANSSHFTYNGLVSVHTGRPWQTLIRLAASHTTGRGGFSEKFQSFELPKGVNVLPMIKAIFLLARQPELTPEEFREYWIEKHSVVISSVSADFRMQRYVQNHVLDSPGIADLSKSRGWRENPYPGVAELWWKNEADMLEAFSSPAGVAAGAKVVEDEMKFIGDDTIVMLCQEYQIFDKALM